MREDVRNKLRDFEASSLFFCGRSVYDAVTWWKNAIYRKNICNFIVSNKRWRNWCFSEKEWLKKQKIADLSFCFEFQVVVAVVGFKWRSWGNAKIADLRSGNAFNSLPQKNALMSFFNGVGSCFSILHRLWICHAALIV